MQTIIKGGGLLWLILMFTACGPDIDGSLYTVGTVIDDPAGDVAAPQADVTRFETTLTERGVLIATFTLAELPDELPRNREGVPAGEVEYAWRVNIWLDGKVSRHAEYRMEAAYTSTGTVFRDATPLERLLDVGVYKHSSAGDFFYVQNTALEYDTAANTLTLRSAVPGINAGSAVLFEVIDGLAGVDTIQN